MTGLTRRRFLRSAASATGGLVAASLLPPGLRRALAAPPVRKPFGDIEHVVVIMQENRSFDHYFGTLKGVRGFDDPAAMRLPNGQSVFHQPDPQSAAGYLAPFHLNTHTASAQAVPSNAHGWEPQHAAWNQGAMDRWVMSQRQAAGRVNGPYTMGYYTRADIPFHRALAESFTICDHYFCSVLGPTWPNRLYLWSASIDPEGRYGGPMNGNRVTMPYRWKTYPERLTEAGVSWHVYQEESDYLLNLLELFQNYQDARPGSPLYDHALAIGPADQFEYDAAHGRLPTVSWIIPTPQQSEHPAYLPASGADFLASKLEAIASNPELWAKTVVIINYDENDGKFDHVAPPTPPSGTPGEFVDGAPIGAGFRVPCLIVSPWTQGGMVCSHPFDHTSVLRFLEQVTGVQASNISDWRRHTFGDLTAALGVHGDKAFPDLPKTPGLLRRAEHGVDHLPPPAIPGSGPAYAEQAGQLAQEPGKNKLARAQTQSRLKAALRAHDLEAAAVPQGTIFPGIVASVMGRPLIREEGSVYAYVCTTVGREVMVIDAGSGDLASGLDVGVNPYRIVATPDGRKLYVTNSGESSVSVISARSNSVRGSIPVGLYPHGIAISPDGLLVYVANTGPGNGHDVSRSVTVINTRTDRAIDTLEVGAAPLALAAAPDQAQLYVTCHDGLRAVDMAARKVRARLAFTDPLRGIAITPDGKQLYVAHCRLGTVSVVDAASLKVVANIKVGKAPWEIAVRPDGKYAYVTNADSDTVSVIDIERQKVTATVDVQHIPTGLVATNEVVWISNNTSSTVQAIDARTFTVGATVPLGLSMEPGGVALVRA